MPLWAQSAGACGMLGAGARSAAGGHTAVALRGLLWRQRTDRERKDIGGIFGQGERGMFF